jgi:CHAT domain-containing protein
MDELRIRQQRLLTEDEAARLQRLKAELDGTEALDQRLSQLRGGAHELPARLEEVAQKKVRLQLEIAEFNKQVARKHDQWLTGTAYNLHRIQTHLPADSALVAWLDEQTGTLSEHWAVVVRKQGAPTWVRLKGSTADGTWTQQEAELGRNVAARIARRPRRRDGEDISALVQELSAQRITPLLPAMAATQELPEVRHLIVLPSTSLSGVPVELLEHPFTVSYAPSAAVLTWLAERSGADTDNSKEHPGGSELHPRTLLAVGDPVFSSEQTAQPRMLLAESDRESLATKGAAADFRQRMLSSVVRGEGQFTSLPGARLELAALSKIFRQRDGSVTLLAGMEATESSLRRLAEARQLAGFRYVHFATHAVADMRQALQSALILSADYQSLPIIEDWEALEFNDGRLSAEEIMRSWDLNADLVALSACRTGLGQYVSGEGHIGFAQALLLAGARSVVLSLWKVDDGATTLLMARFYQNLLITPPDQPKTVSKAEALWEAKKWLRQLTPDEVALELERLDIDSVAERGIKTRRLSTPKQADTTSENTSLKPYAHPFYWAGFVLIGDPN